MLTFRRVLITLTLAAALAGMVLVLSNEDEAEEPLDSRVERVVPVANSLVLRQARVGIDLVPGYDAVLLIDSTFIPEDQLIRNEPQNEVFYQPGEGLEIEQLTPGRHCVTAQVWDVTRGRERTDNIRWCFNVS